MHFLTIKSKKIGTRFRNPHTCTHFTVLCSPNTKTNQYTEKKSVGKGQTPVKYCFHIIIGVVQ